ncbi:unnamed protein product [Paramecium pentaurelia]|uniref:Uncharacterized protein n=1 Tax=Paramecium pentaurelia TaxID=43138 RepID=A0A8S1XE21_9CILI|nr:unnamed protein product [Paramecium pentaurelia]
MIYKIINKFSVYIDPSKFPNGDLLSIYKSTEGKSIKLFNVFYLGLIGYNAYSYMQDKQNSQYALNDLTAASYKSGMENSIIIMAALGIGMIFFYWKTNKTLFNLWLSPNGKSIVMDSYSLFGLNSRSFYIDIENFRGFSYFLHPSLRIPMFKYKLGSTTRTMFFKHQYVLDEQIMKSVLQGQDIIVRPKGMEKELSSNQKKKYNL